MRRRAKATLAPLRLGYFESRCDRAAFLHHRHFGHVRVLRTVGATPQHVGDDFGRTREYGLHASVPHIADRAVKAEGARRLLGPRAEADTLHPAFDLDGHGPDVCVLSYSAPAFEPGNDKEYPALREFEYHGIDVEAVAGLGQDLGDFHVALGFEHVLHLHRLD